MGRQTQNRPIQLKPAFISRARPSNPRTESTGQENYQNHSKQQRNESVQKSRLTREEEDNLADYLALGMTLTEARQAFQKEVEMAELRARVRENRRNINRGDINPSNRTQLGNTNRGRGRGGLSFN